MGVRRRKKMPALLLAAVLGVICAAALGGIFYGTMVYQLAPGQQEDTPVLQAAYASPAPLDGNADPAALFPGRLLALGTGTLMERRAQDVRVDGVLCRVITADYSLADGQSVRAVSAYPAAYIGTLAKEGWTPQLLTGCELAQMEAVCEMRGEEGLLAARSGECVYLLIGPGDGQALYALGAACTLE